MKRCPAPWQPAVAVLALMALAALLIQGLQARQRLGEPGVEWRPGPAGGLAGEIPLPVELAGGASRPMEVTPGEREYLPEDTSFGRRIYRTRDGFEAMVSVVLMGRDRTSIHKPQLCLTGQGWRIESARDAVIPVEGAEPYRLPVKELRAGKAFATEEGPVALGGVYIYWFVADGRLTREHWQRMWWMAGDLLTTGVLPRPRALASSRPRVLAPYRFTVHPRR